MRLSITALVAVAGMVASGAQGCENQADPATIPDGITNISKNMRGIWNAPGGRNCRWWISTKSGGGTKTNNGNLRQKNPARSQSQTALIGTGNVGQFFHSDNCAPKGWTRG